MKYCYSSYLREAGPLRKGRSINSTTVVSRCFILKGKNTTKSEGGLDYQAIPYEHLEVVRKKKALSSRL